MRKTKFNRRVVVTGVGIEAPAGRFAPGDKSYLDNMLDHRPPPGIIEMAFDHKRLPVHVYGCTPWIDDAMVTAALTKAHRRIKRWLGRHSQIAVVAARSALTSAGIVEGVVGPEGSIINQNRFALSSSGDVQDLDFAIIKAISDHVRQMGDVPYDELLQILAQACLPATPRSRTASEGRGSSP